MPSIALPTQWPTSPGLLCVPINDRDFVLARTDDNLMLVCIEREQWKPRTVRCAWFPSAGLKLSRDGAMTVGNRVGAKTQLAMLDPLTGTLSSMVTVGLPAYDHAFCSPGWTIASMASGNVFHLFDADGNVVSAVGQPPRQTDAVAGSLPPGVLYAGKFAAMPDGGVIFAYHNFPFLHRLDCAGHDLGGHALMPTGTPLAAPPILAAWPKFERAGAEGAVARLSDAVAVRDTIVLLHGAFGSSRLSFWSMDCRHLSNRDAPARSFSIWWAGDMLGVASCPREGTVIVDFVPVA